MTRGAARIEDLLARARRGDAEATASLIDSVRARVVRWALVITGDSDDAEDVAQQVSLTLHRSLRGYEGRSRFTTWLYAVVRNAALGSMQRAHRLHETDELDDADVMRRCDDAADVLDAIHQRQAASIVRSFLTELSGRQRELIELVDIEGRTVVEASRMLSIEPETGRVHLMRARRALRSRMLELHPEIVE